MTQSTTGQSGELTPRVMALVECMKELVAKGMQSGVDDADFCSLEALLADDFERVGPFHDAKDWPGYRELVKQWVNNTQGWRPELRRIAEAPGLVFMQCEEMITHGDSEFPFHSLSMYEFDKAGRIRRIEVYMQKEDAQP